MTTTLEPAAGLARYGAVVTDDLRRRFVTAGHQPYLAAPMSDYPSRRGKALRPSMCLASCEAFGGPLGDALPSAVAIELLHNAFLVHDDIEDASLLRRGEPTLHRRYGTPLALNAGDGLALQALATLRENIDLLGPRLADRIMMEFDFMSQQTVAGQALERCRAQGRDSHTKTRLAEVFTEHFGEAGVVFDQENALNHLTCDCRGRQPLLPAVLLMGHAVKLLQASG